MGNDLVTAEMAAMIDRDWPPVVLEVDRTGIRMWARAVGYTDPVFYDEDVARARGFDRLPCPPGFLGTPRFSPAGPEPGPPIRGLNPALPRSLNGGTEVEHLMVIMAGDVLESTTRIVSIEERTGSIGPFILISRVATVRRAREVVARARATVINY